MADDWRAPIQAAPWSHNRSSDISLPQGHAFFQGRKCQNLGSNIRLQERPTFLATNDVEIKWLGSFQAQPCRKTPGCRSAIEFCRNTVPAPSTLTEKPCRFGELYENAIL